MKKSILNLGTTLSKDAQKEINGGFFSFCNTSNRDECNARCVWYDCIGACILNVPHIAPC